MLKKICAVIMLAGLLPGVHAAAPAADSDGSAVAEGSPVAGQATAPSLGLDHTGWYGGIDLGGVRVEADHQYGTREVDHAGSFGFYGGYNFTDYFGLELAFGESGNLSENRFYDIYYLPVMFTPKFTFQATEWLGLYLKAGVATGVYAQRFNYEPYNADEAIVWSGGGGVIGVGGVVSVTKNLNLRLNYDHTRMSMSPTDDFYYNGTSFVRVYDLDVTADRVTVGVHWQF